MSIHNLDMCNKCGNALDLFDAQQKIIIESTLGYGSEYDGSKIRIRLCCKCLDELIRGCKVNPIIE